MSFRLGQNVRVFSSSIQYLRQKGFCSNMYMLTQQSIMVTDFKTKLNLFTVQDQKLETYQAFKKNKNTRQQQKTEHPFSVNAEAIWDVTK